MTIDEAIKHAEEVADQNEKRASWFWGKEGNQNYENCVECAAEHRQLVEWLKDYKRLLDQQPCGDCVSRQAVLDQTYLWSKDEFLRVTNPFDYLRKRINSLPPVTPLPKTGYISIDDAMSAFDDFMRGDVDENDTETFLEMLKDKAEGSEE